MQVDTVEQGTRNPSLIVSGATGGTAAGERGVTEMTASAWVHRRDQLNARRERDVRVGAGDTDIARLKRLPERIEDWSLELGQLVEEEHAEVREADLARTNAKATSDQCRHGRAVVRRPERAAAPNPATVELASNGGDHRHFERFARLQWRKNPRQACRKEGLSR